MRGTLTDGREMNLVDCVAFLLVKGDTFLVERRRIDAKCDPGTVAIPGGHVEPGEETLYALRRELSEELGVVAGKVQFLCTLIHYSTEVQRVHYFLVEEWSGTMKVTEAESVEWLNIGEGEHLTHEVDRIALREHQRFIASGPSQGDAADA